MTYLIGKNALFEAPHADRPRVGEIVGVGYPFLALRPRQPLEAENGERINLVVRATWMIDIVEGHNGQAEGPPKRH